MNVGGTKVGAKSNTGYKSDSSDGETYAARKFGGNEVRRLPDSDAEDNILRGDSVVVSKGGHINRANKRNSNAGEYNARQRSDTIDSADK